MGTVTPIHRPLHDTDTPKERMPRRRPLWREAVGAFLRQVRTHQERTLADVAEAAGVSTQYLSEVERGRKEPSSEILGAVADALGLNLADLTWGVTGVLERERADHERRMGALDPLRSIPSPEQAPESSPHPSPSGPELGTNTPALLLAV
jgi:transcriptional regulator with XRE-family HTH domain